MPLGKGHDDQLIDAPQRARAWVDQAFRDHPELSPPALAQGDTMLDRRASVKRGVRQRRMRCRAAGEAFSIRPWFVLPSGTAGTGGASGPLGVRAFGVPFRALARVFGRDPLYGYRLEVGLGRHRLVGTAARQADIPHPLSAGEHPPTRDGVQN